MRLQDDALARIDDLLDPVDRVLDRDYPGDRLGGQPAHTVYVLASDVTGDIASRWGAEAVHLLDTRTDVLAGLVDAETVARVRDVLVRSPIRDLRVDFEDGYGWRGDDVETAHAQAAGTAIALLAADPAGPSVVGVRTKGLGAAERRRGITTLDTVLGALMDAGGVPAEFVFTVPKLRAAEQVPAVVALCDELERAHGLPPRTLRFEMQIESPQAVIGSDGTATVARAIHLADGRCSGLHYGTYDYSAACGITSGQQSLEHPVADHAKDVMLAAAAQTGVWVCDGSTQVVPVGDDEWVREAMTRHFRLVTRSLQRGFYQGWDMHPGHLVTRWAATFAFFRDALAPAATRLQAYLDRQSGSVVDEPATAQALAGVLVRGLGAGAFDPADVTSIGPNVTEAVLDGLIGRKVLTP